MRKVGKQYPFIVTLQIGAILAIIAIFNVSFSSPYMEKVALLLLGALLGITVFISLTRYYLGQRYPAVSSLGTIDAVSEELTRLRDLAERYSALVDHLAAALIIRDLKGRVTFCSAYTEVLTGYALDEFYTADEDLFRELTPQADRELFDRALKINLTGEPFQFRYRLRHRSGLEIWVDANSVPIHSQSGELVCVLTVIFDITSLVRTQLQLEERNKDIEDFTYMVSHDLKGPIATFRGMLNLLQEELPKPRTDTVQEALGHLEAAALRLDTLVKGILEYAKVAGGELKLEPVELDSVLSDAIADYRGQIEESQAEVIAPTSMPMVLGDRMRLYQVFSNLLSNAIKYRASERLLKVQFSSTVESSGRRTTISIEDNGVGVPADKIGLLFRPFQRIHVNRAEGAGIGLAATKKIIERMGGTLTVKSTEGVGSCFTVTLPATTP